MKDESSMSQSSANSGNKQDRQDIAPSPHEDDDSLKQTEHGEERSAPAPTTSDSMQQSASPESKRKAKTPRRGKSPITTLPELLQYAYSRRGQKLAVNKKTASQIAQAVTLGDGTIEQVQSLAKDDTLLAVPKQLLLVALQYDSLRPLSSALQRSVAAACRFHAATPVLQLIQIDPPVDEDAVDDHFAAAVRFDYRGQLPQESGKPLSKAHADKLRSNLVATLALWLIVRHRMSVDQVTRILFRAVWTPSAPRPKSVLDRARLFAELHDWPTAGMICASFAEEAETHRIAADDAEASLSKANVELKAKEAKINELTNTIEERDRTIRNWEERHRQVEADHEIAITHIRDDYESLRARVLRSLGRELDLLETGLQALRRDPPKVHVMVDHAERAMAGLHDEVEQLKGERA
ncbi:MAG TPA: hypothetical protein PK098_09675 [Phycisphaerales bacterium]|nr:hypothetical protein [Phycisphaerales bacterium]